MEQHEHAKVWEKLPTETLINEQERIHLELEDLTSRAETIGEIIMNREVETS